MEYSPLSRDPQNPSAGRTEILTAATDLFAECGYDGVSINAIACRAGTSKANVFHHFGSKDALYLETMRCACSAFEPVLDRLRETDRGFGERLRHFVRDDIGQMFAEPDRARLILREVLESGPSRGRELATEVFDEHFARLVEMFRDGQRAGSLTDEVPPALAASIAIACNVFLFQSQHVLRHLSGVDFVDDPERYAALVSRVLLEGLAGDEDARGTDGRKSE